MGKTVVCYVGHNTPYECRVENREEKKSRSKLYNTYTNKVKQDSYQPYILKREEK